MRRNAAAKYRRGSHSLPPHDSIPERQITEKQMGGRFMLNRKLMTAAAAVAFGLLTAGGACAQDTVKIGLIVSMTGQQASTGKQIKAAVDLFQKEHGNTVAGKKVEVILRDSASVPDNTKRSGAGIDRQRQGQHHRRLRDHAGGARDRPACDRSESAGHRDGGGHLDHHRAFALYRAHKLHRRAILRHHRRLGREKRHQEGRDHRVRLRAGRRRARIRSANGSPPAAAR